MSKYISASGVILFCIIPLRFLIEWAPLLGLPYISSFCVIVQYLAMLTCFFKLSSSKDSLKFPKLTKWAIGIFVLYTMYLIYDIVLFPKMLRIDMLHVPETNTSLYQNIISFCLIFLLVNLLNKKVNYTRWAKVSCIFLTFMLIIYILKVDLSYYALTNIINKATGESVYSLNEMGMFDGLRLGWFCGITYVCNLFLKNKWAVNPILCKGLFWFITVLSVGICMATIQRGPILFIISTTLFYYYAKGYISHRNFGWIVFVILIFIIFSDSIIDFFYIIAPDLMGRFGDIMESGSGRYGSDDSAFSMAFKEFLMNPIWGHYFRFTTAKGYFYGLYPHNILLESLMTMGLLGSIPFFYILYRCVKNAYYAIKEDAPIAVIGLIFIYIFSTLMTSSTMVLKDNFWIPLVLISSYIKKNRL